MIELAHCTTALRLHCVRKENCLAALARSARGIQYTPCNIHRDKWQEHCNVRCRRLLVCLAHRRRSIDFKPVTLSGHRSPIVGCFFSSDMTRAWLHPGRVRACVHACARSCLERRSAVAQADPDECMRACADMCESAQRHTPTALMGGVQRVEGRVGVHMGICAGGTGGGAGGRLC